MRHYGIGQWTDFVRGTAAEKDTSSMKKHLADGCDSCSRVLASLRAVEHGGSPIGGADSRLTGRSGELATEVMDLVWDSARAPFQLADAGPAESGRQLNFTTSEFDLSVRLESGADGAASVLMARLQSRFEAPTSEFEVRLTAGKQAAEPVVTGELGEFELPLDSTGPFELLIVVDEHHRLVAKLAG